MPLSPVTRRVAWIVAATSFMLLLDGALLNTSLPQMAASLGSSTLDLSASVTVFLLTSAAFTPCSAWLAERFETRRVFVLSIGVFTLASVGCGLAQSLPELVVARAIQGAAGGVMFPVGRMLVIRNASNAELMDATALITWPALLAPVLGPPLGGFITSYVSWRLNFLINLPLGLLGLWLVLRWVPRIETPRPAPLDWTGAITSATALVLLMIGLETGAHAGAVPTRWAWAAGLVIAGCIGMALAVAHLRRTPHPVVSLAPLAQRTFAMSSIRSGTWQTMCIQATPFLLPVMFQVAFDASPVHAGLLTLVYFAGNLIMKSVTTPILRRFGFRTVGWINGCLAALSLAACGFIEPRAAPWIALPVLFIAGATRSMQLTTLNTLAFADIEPAQRSAAATLSGISMQVASVTGVAAGALLLAVSQLAHGREVLAHEDFSLAFSVLGALSLAAALRFLGLAPDDGSEVSGHRPSPSHNAAG